MSAVFEHSPTVTPAQANERFLTYEDLLAELPETNRPHELWDGHVALDGFISRVAREQQIEL